MVVDLVIRGGHVVTPDGRFPGGVAIDDGRIVAVGGDTCLPLADRTIRADGKLILPGVVDPHTHPGKRDFATDLRTETRAAIVGGVTTMGAIIKSTRMGPYEAVPRRIPSYRETFPAAKVALDQNSFIDVYYNFAILTDEQADEIPYYAREFGVTSFKFYLGYMGGDRTTRQAGLGDWCSRLGFPDGFDDGTVYLGFERIGQVGPPCIAHIHAENLFLGRVFYRRVYEAGRWDPAGWSDRSPGLCEAIHIRTYAYLARVTGAPLYVVHLNTLEGLAELRRSRADGASIVAETCPQYLWITTDDDPPGVWGKSSPPLRSRGTTEGLLRAVQSGEIGCLGTDHCPNRREDHVGGALLPPGVPGLFRSCSSSGVQTLLPSMLHYGVLPGRLSVERVVEVCCRNPASAAGLYPRKGALMVGSDGDVLVVDGKASKRVTPETIQSPYLAFFQGRVLSGWPVVTVLRGQVVMEEGVIGGKPGDGVYLPRRLGGAGVSTGVGGVVG